MSSTDTDLSAYELQRLENIKRNREVLAALGLGGPSSAGASSASVLLPKKAAKRAVHKRQRHAASEPRPGHRQSRRLRSRSADGSALPQEPEVAEEAKEEEEEDERGPQ